MVLWKVLTIVFVLLGSFLLPVDEESAALNFDYPASAEWPSAPFLTWDSNHYLYIADNGYAEGHVSNAFSPLFPATVRLAALPLGGSFVWALLIANLASGAGIVLFYLWARDLRGSQTAFTAMLLLMAFPTAFFFNLIYSEGVFLLLASGLLLCLHRGNLLIAALLAFLMPLARSIGIFVFVPLAVYLLEMALKQPGETVLIRLVDLVKARLATVLLVLAPLFGSLAAHGYMFFDAGDAFATHEAAGSSSAGWQASTVLQPWKVAQALVPSDIAIHGALNSAIDRALFLLFLMSLPLVYRRMDRWVLVWCVAMTMQPFLGSFMSYTRYFLMALPLFLVAAEIVSRWTPIWRRRAVLYLGMLQPVFLLLHSANYWVA